MSAGRLSAMFALCLYLLANTSNGVAQEPDVARLVHPEMAQRLSLDDAQRAKIQELLLQRSQALVPGLAEAERLPLNEKYRQEILAVLNAEQQAMFTASEPMQKLMFQFREMKWEDVLNWFAQQQDLTLIMDRTPGGTFTYSDTRSYSPSEGIDLLNSVLMTRGFTLVRREKMLVLMELSESIPLELLPRVGLEQLDERGRFELVSVLFPLAGRPIDAVLREVKPYLSGYGRAIPLAQSSQLLVVETAGKMRTINELIASVPVPKEAKADKPEPPPKPVFAAYPLSDADSAAVLETIRKLIPSEQITVDAKTNVLSAFVIPEQQTAIKSAIEQMLSSRSALPVAASIAYRFSGIKPEELQQQISQLAPRATITTSANRILVTAGAEDQQRIQNALQALDIEPVAIDKTLQVFDVSVASAEQVGTALRTFLPNSYVAVNAQVGSVLVRGSEEDLRLAADIVKIWQQRQATAGINLRAFSLDRIANSDWLATVQRIVPEAKVWLSGQPLGQEQQQLMVLGDLRDISAIETILPQLLTLLPEPDKRQLKIYQLSKSQRARRATLNTLPSELADIKLADGQTGDELLVWASPQQHDAFAGLLEQIDQPLLTKTLVPKSYALNVDNSATVTQLLTAEFPGVQFTVNSAGTELTVLANAEDQTRIAERVAEFNAELPSRPEQVFESYLVNGMTASALQQSLAPLLTGTQATIDADGRRLLVRADPQRHAELRELAKVLSAKPEVGQQKVVVAYPLNHATATNVKVLLDQIVRDATVLADDKLRQLVVTGTLETQATVKATLDQIDRIGGTRAPAEIHSYDAGQLQAAALLPTLQAMWPQLQLTADTTTNQVIASGTALEQEELRAALEELKAAPGGEARIAKTYPVPFGEMSTLPAVLKQLAPQALISSDSISRTITVWAAEAQQTRVQQALDELTKTAQASQEPATYLVKPTQILAVQTSLRTLFPAVGVAADTTTGQLIVVAPKDTQQRVAAVIELLSQGPNAEQNTTKVFEFDPKRVELADLLSALQTSIPPQVRLESNASNHTILAIGVPVDLQRVEELIQQLVEQLPQPKRLAAVVYSLEHADPTAAYTVLSRLLPQTVIAQDLASRTITATAGPDEQQTIAEFLEAFDKPSAGGKQTRVYRLQRGNGQGLAYVLGSLMPDATFYGSRDRGALVATALPEQHERIDVIIKEFDNDRENTETRVFTVGNANASSLRTAVQEFASQAVVTADTATNSLIVTATRDELEHIAEIVQQVDSGGGQPRTTRFYPVLGSEPQTLQLALKTGFPKTTLSADAASGGLFATATEQDHAELAKTIEELNSQPTRLPTLKTFVLKYANPAVAAGAIEDALGRRSRAGVSFNRETKSVFVVGSREDLLAAETLISQIDVAGDISDSRKLKVFTLGGSDGQSITRAIENLFRESARPVDVRYDSLNEQLFVVGEAEQLALVEETLAQLTPPARQLEIVQLDTIDPLSFQLAADALFEDEPLSSAPSITVNRDQQQVMIRATPPQLEAIRQLLKQMGETSYRGDVGRSGRLRFVPVHRNSEKLLEDIRRLWPAVKANPLEVVRPKSSSAEPPIGQPNASTDEAEDTESENVESGRRLTSTQPPTDQGVAPAPASPSDTATDLQAPPVVIVVGEEQWTLASTDTAALDQFQRLLDTLLSPKIEPFATTGNYSVYLLSHAGAEQIEQLLTDLFRPDRGRSSSFSDMMQRIRIVADPRINALIVSGSRADRRTVEEILGVLDSEDLLDSLQQVTPTVIALKNASASNVEAIIRNVYRSQLSSGAGRRPVAIPEGVSLEVASVLQQINAQSSGPLLTIAVDDTSNSVVVRGPPELTVEIRRFVESLDEQAQGAPSKRVDLIRLQSTNTRSLQQALKILMAK